MKASIKNLGTRAEEELYKEFLLLYNMNTFAPIFKKDLSCEQIKKALDTISVIKEKRELILMVRNKGYRSLKPNQLC